MHLSGLRLTNFRNFSDQRLEIPAAGLAIIGDNGQGKTNFLEAIYYLEIFRSFRGVADQQLVRFGEDVFRVEGMVEDTGWSRVRRVAAAFDRKQKRKKVTVDGVEPERLSDAIGRVGAVVFSPSDVAIVSGAPAVRRRFLDILLSLAEPRYLDDLQRYRHVLAQRNTLLREGQPAASIAAWNEVLVRAGTRITEARRSWIGSRSHAFSDQVRRIAGGGEAALEYEPSLPLPGDLPGETGTVISEIFARELLRVAERERRQGATLIGPHRDDMRIRASATGRDWIDLRVFGSGGQQRTAAVALRICEAQTLRQRLATEPIILMDDVFAELDIGRSRRILEWVDDEARAQVILTAPKASDLQLHGRSLSAWKIESGRFSPL